MTTRVELSEVPVTPPLSVLAGDVLERDGNTINVIRGGNVVASATLGTPEPIESGEITSPRTVSSLFQVEVVPMAGITDTLVDVSVNQTTGSVTFKFSSGDNIEYQSWADAKAAGEAFDTDQANCQKALLCRLARLEPDGSNLDALNGSSCTIDGNAATPVQFSLTA